MPIDSRQWVFRWLITATMPAGWLDVSLCKIVSWCWIISCSSVSMIALTQCICVCSKVMLAPPPSLYPKSFGWLKMGWRNCFTGFTCAYAPLKPIQNGFPDVSTHYIILSIGRIRLLHVLCYYITRRISLSLAVIPRTAVGEFGSSQKWRKSCSNTWTNRTTRLRLCDCLFTMEWCHKSQVKQEACGCVITQLLEFSIVNLFAL
jgi:hypothetical protein